MQFEISQELVDFIEREMKAGHFASRKDVVVAGLQMLKQDREEAIAGLQQGLAEWKRGEGTSLDEAFAKIRANPP